ISYAHLQPFGPRLDRWTNSFKSREFVLGTRGPEISGVTRGGSGEVTPKFKKDDSIALKLLGDGKAWSGHLVSNDDHVSFHDKVLASGKPLRTSPVGTYTGEGKKLWPDVWCYDEPDDEAGANTFLGLFVKAGAKREDWGAAWD